MIWQSRALRSRIRRSGDCERWAQALSSAVLRPLNPWYCARTGFGLNGMSLEKYAGYETGIEPPLPPDCEHGQYSDGLRTFRKRIGKQGGGCEDAERRAFDTG